MTITMKSSSRSDAASTSLVFVQYSVPHEGHTYYNDDTILLDRRRGLAAIFDGVGSGPGQIASRLAAKVIRKQWKKLHSLPVIISSATELDLEASLLTMFNEAHQQILLEGERRAKNLHEFIRYPATTAALSLFCQQEQQNSYRMFYAHVGDSRIYHWRPQEALKRLTDDDGYLALKLLDGSITPEDAVRIDQAVSENELSRIEKEYFDNRNGITQALGHERVLIVHTGQIDINPGDRILLCSDGIHDNLTDQALATLLETESRTAVAKKIVQCAIDCSHQPTRKNIRAKSDDMSAVVVMCNSSC